MLTYNLNPPCILFLIMIHDAAPSHKLGLTSNFFACEDDCLVTAPEGLALSGSMARIVIATAQVLGENLLCVLLYNFDYQILLKLRFGENLFDVKLVTIKLNIGYTLTMLGGVTANFLSTLSDIIFTVIQR